MESQQPEYVDPPPAVIEASETARLAELPPAALKSNGGKLLGKLPSLAHCPITCSLMKTSSQLSALL